MEEGKENRNDDRITCGQEDETTDERRPDTLQGTGKVIQDSPSESKEKEGDKQDEVADTQESGYNASAEPRTEEGSEMMLAQDLGRIKLNVSASEVDEAAAAEDKGELDIRKDTTRINNQKIQIADVFAIDWVERNLKIVKKLHSLTGHTQLYPLVKSILNYFFCNGLTVLIMTPFIDQEILKDIFGLFINSEAKGRSFWILTRAKHNLFVPAQRRYVEYKITEVEEHAKRLLGSSFHDLVNGKYRICIPSGSFHLKCMAGISNDKALVVSTTANFTLSHFGILGKVGENIDTVQYSTMQLKDFESKVMQPLWERLDQSVKVEMQTSFPKKVSNT